MGEAYSKIGNLKISHVNGPLDRSYEETRGVLKIFLENVIRDSVTYTEHAKRFVPLHSLFNGVA